MLIAGAAELGAWLRQRPRVVRLTALRYHVPGAVTFLLIAVAMVATGFTGYYAGNRVATFIMSLTIAVVIMLVIDLDHPASGLIRVPLQSLIDAQ